jgi:hypothetical protein
MNRTMQPNRQAEQSGLAAGKREFFEGFLGGLCTAVLCALVLLAVRLGT